MQLKSIGKNKTIITYKVADPTGLVPNTLYDKDVYFSYGQPVVIVDWLNHNIYKTVEKYSRTTSKHATEFMRLSNRFDYDSKNKPVIIPKWTFIHANEMRMHELAENRMVTPRTETLTHEVI